MLSLLTGLFLCVIIILSHKYVLIQSEVKVNFNCKQEEKEMNKQGLVAEVRETTGFSKKDAEVAVNAVFAALKKGTIEDGKVSIADFGTLSTKQREERAGRNPQTGEAITIAAHTAIGFKASPSFKDAANQ